VSQTEQKHESVPRCTLCPALCSVVAVQSGPDAWRSECEQTDQGAMCPRGSAMGDLLGHRRRILSARRRRGAQTTHVDIPAALSEIASRVGGTDATILLDGNLPCEEMAVAAAWCKAWPGAKLCLVIEPADEQLLLGIEASGADYLAGADLSECDGFLIVGDALAANPTCAKGIFDRRKTATRTPIVVIDPGAGTGSKFATHVVDTAVGGELAALAAVAAAAGLDAAAGDNASAAAAGKALAGCKRLAVLIAAEHARGAAWRQIGYLAGQLAKAKGGGVAAETFGANALAAVRLGPKLGAIPLAAAAENTANWIAVGCDPIGLLGWTGRNILAAACPLPNATTDAAEIVLPVALPWEIGGTYLGGGARSVKTLAMLPPPAGVPTPAQLVESLARAAGIGACERLSAPDPAARTSPDKPSSAPAPAKAPSPALLLGRQAAHAGSGALSGYGPWQAEAIGMPELRVSVEDARELGLKAVAIVTVRANGQAAGARVKIAPELKAGRLVISEGFALSRALAPCRADGGQMAAEPVVVAVSKESASAE